jgi:hypothetical protein
MSRASSGGGAGIRHYGLGVDRTRIANPGNHLIGRVGHDAGEVDSFADIVERRSTSPLALRIALTV